MKGAAMPPRSLILVRHGESEHHIRGLTGGWTDTPMTPTGLAQAQRAAERLAKELDGVPVTIYSSDLVRASQTAEAIGTALGVTPVFDARLREHNNGECANLTHEEAFARYPNVYGQSLPLDEAAYPGAETARDLFDRAGAFINSLQEDGTTPIAVSHGGTIVCLVGQWLGLTAETLEPMGFEALPTCITVLRRMTPFRDTSGTSWPVVERLNDISHLAGMDGWRSIGAVTAPPK
jgi:probable phosphoglycerate mutase